jgi:pimeloyl-ACP methyl ester carboxylesterase
MFKCALRVFAIFAVLAPAALAQTQFTLDSSKVKYMAPTGIFVPKGDTITINATGTVSLTDANGTGVLTVNAIGVIQSAPDENLDAGFFDFLTDDALPPLQPPAPGKIKFPPGNTGAILIGAYGALVLGLSPVQCAASSAADFPNGFFNPGTGAGPLSISGGYLYLGVQRDNEVDASGTYAVTISLSGNANPPLTCSALMDVLDPVPNFLNPIASTSPPYFTITGSASALTSGGRSVTGVAADGVAQLLIRARGVDPTHTIAVVLLDENNNMAPPDGEDGTLFSLFGGAVPVGEAVIPTVQNVDGINYVFVGYKSPIDYARSGGGDNATAFRKIGIVVFDTNTNVAIATTQLNLFRPPVFFIHGLWSGPGTWDDFSVQLWQSIDGITSSTADYQAFNWDSVMNNTPRVFTQMVYALNSFKTANSAAAAQLDLVVHSMGGLISNTMPNLVAFQSPANYGSGYIHKLITIDTPYQGSQLAAGLNKIVPNAGCRQLLNGFGALSLGAVMDLDPASSFIASFKPAPAGYAKHAIASFVTPSQTTEAEDLIDVLTLPGSPVGICRNLLSSPAGNGPPSFSFSSFFLTANDPFEGSSDLIVSERSQLSTYSPGTTATITFGLAHSHIVSGLFIPVDVPGALDSNIGTPLSNPAVVVNLLNTPTKNAGVFVQ